MSRANAADAGRLCLAFSTVSSPPSPGSQFLRSQTAVACDFFTVDTAMLRRYFVLFFIHIPSRQVFFAGVTATPVANAFAERWIGSGRRQLLDRTIIWNQMQLQRLCDGLIHEYRNAA